MHRFISFASMTQNFERKDSLRSKFTFKSYLVLILTIVCLYLLFMVVPAFFGNPYYDNKPFPKIFILGLIIFTFIYLVFGELRTKYITIELTQNNIVVKRFFGAIIKSYKASEIDGWKYSMLPSRGGTYEYLYFYKNNKKKIKISEFYHKNYKQLKNEIQSQYKYLGYEEFSYLDELKEMFK